MMRCRCGKRVRIGLGAPASDIPGGRQAAGGGASADRAAGIARLRAGVELLKGRAGTAAIAGAEQVASAHRSPGG